MDLCTEDCCDRVSIYDGPTSNSPLLLTAAGCRGLPGLVISSSNRVLVLFSSDGSVQYRGFNLTYSHEMYV